MNDMNALVVTTTGGFLPHFELNNVKILQNKGYEIHYASDFINPVYECDKDMLQNNGIILHQISIRKSPKCISSNIRAVKELVHIIDKNNITLIHCHNPMGGVTARIAAHISKNKPYVIYTSHGFHFYKGAPAVNWLAYYPVERVLARYTDLIITINHEDYNLASRFKLKEHGFTAYIHGTGVDMDEFIDNRDIKSRENLRHKLGVPVNAMHIVTVAELNDNKNQITVIEALARMNNPDIYYTMCGDGPMRYQLKKIIKERHLENQIHIMGYRCDIPDILNTADVSAFPSKREGLGLAAIEALACGVPVVAADNRGTREYIHDGINGIVCRSTNIDDYVNAFSRLYEDREYRLRLASECRESVAEYDYRRTVDAMETLYQRCISSCT